MDLKIRDNLRDRWLELLRDPDAKQGRFALKDADGSQCCLGVACDAYIEIVGGVDWVLTERYKESVEGDCGRVECYGLNFTDDPIEAISVLPQQIADAFGIDRYGSRTVCRPGLGPAELTHANDSLGLTFEDIADLVESGAYYLP